MKSKIKNLKDNKGFMKYFKNTSWLFGEKIIRIFLSFLVGIWVARYLGPERLGLLSFAQSFVAIFAIFASLGLDNIVIRELVKDDKKRDIILGSTFLIKLLSSILIVVLTYLLSIFFHFDKTTQALLIVISFSTLFSGFQVIDFYFQAKVSVKFSTFANLITIVFSAILKILLIILHASLIYFAFVILIESIILSIFYIYFYHKNNLYIKNWSINYKVLIDMIKDSWPFILSAFAVVIYMKIDILMIKQMLDDNAVGQYSVAVRLSEVWNFIPVVISASLFPAIFNAKKNAILYKQRLEKLYTLLAIIAIVISFTIAYLSNFIVTFLFGKAYYEAIAVLQIHIWGTLFTFLLVASGKWLVSENLGKHALYRNLSGAVINIVLNYILLPIYGIVGAAYATLVSYAIAGLFYDLYDIKLRSNFKLKINAIFLTNFWYHKIKINYRK